MTFKYTDDLKDIECRNVFCLNCDGEICLIFDRKSQLDKCIAKKRFYSYIEAIDKEIEADATLNRIFDTDEWWWYKKNKDEFKSPVSDCLKRTKKMFLTALGVFF